MTDPVSVAMMVLGSALVFGGRAYSQVRAIPLVPMFWTWTGEVSLAFAPLMMSVLDGHALLCARVLWLMTGIVCFALGIRVGHMAELTVRHSKELHDLTLAAIQEGLSVHESLKAMRRTARRLRREDPLFDAVWRESGLEDPSTYPDLQGPA